MRELIATYKIVTPMFIGGADQSPSDGIRPPSVKGALRFWWRALNWGRFWNDSNKDEITALKNLHEAEAFLFGTAKDGGKQAAFLLGIESIVTAEPWNKNVECGVQYLLGQGLFRFGQGILRDALPSGAELKLKLIMKPSISKNKDYFDQLKDACILMGCLGGLGSRSRKGFGSLAIQSIIDGGKRIVIPTNEDELISFLSKFTNCTDQPPFTAFSSNTRVDISLRGNNPLTLLEKVGQEMQKYRSYGRNKQVCNKFLAEKNFGDEEKQGNDHDLMLNYIKGTNPDTIPQRTVFGLPHNYFYSSVFAEEQKKLKREKGIAKKKATIYFSLSEEKRGIKMERRASPLFIHVHTFPDGNNLVIQSLFPAVFLMDGDRLKFKNNQNIYTIRFNSSFVDYKIITDYLDRYTQRKRLL